MITPKNGLELDTSVNLIEELKGKIIPGKVPPIDSWDSKDMNNDVYLFYQLCQAVMTGEISEKLLNRKMPKVTTNRWVNTATSILRLYIQTKDPWRELKRLVIIILDLYGPLVFLTRIHWECYNGSMLYWAALNNHNPFHLTCLISLTIFALGS